MDAGGHQQMMTDPMRPPGISVWQLTAMAPMLEAGGRLFVDATRRPASPRARARFLDAVGRSFPPGDRLLARSGRGNRTSAAPSHLHGQKD